MKKGTAILLDAGSSNVDAVTAVYNKYADKIRSPKGWFGNATVNIKTSDDDDSVARTLIVKAVNGGFDVYEKTEHVPIRLEAKIGAESTDDDE
jgi:hypothetical protein